MQACTVADPGEGQGGQSPPLLLDQTEAKRPEKIFWRLLPPFPLMHTRTS